MGNRYFKNGTLDDPLFTGVTLMVVREGDTSSIGYVTADGEPYYGYMAEELTAEDYAMWWGRISQPDFQVYFPSPMGGILNAARYSEFKGKVDTAVKEAQEVTQRQAKQQLIIMGLDEAIPAGIAAVADVTQQKLMLNWYSNSQSWQYKNPFLTSAFATMGVDKDDFFAAAKLL